LNLTYLLHNLHSRRVQITVTINKNVSEVVVGAPKE